MEPRCQPEPPARRSTPDHPSSRRHRVVPMETGRTADGVHQTAEPALICAKTTPAQLDLRIPVRYSRGCTSSSQKSDRSGVAPAAGASRFDVCRVRPPGVGARTHDQLHRTPRRCLMQDIVSRVPALSFIDVADVLVFARPGRTSAEGAFATCHCLSLPPSEPGYYFWRDRHRPASRGAPNGSSPSRRS